MIRDLFSEKSNYDLEIQQIIELYEALPYADPYKQELYSNIINVIDYEAEWNNPTIRIINGQVAGTSFLSEIGNSATKIQDMFSNAYKKIVALSENIQSPTIQDRTAMLAHVKEGSIIFEVKRIGKESPGQEDLIDINTDKVDLLNELIKDAYAIDYDLEKIRYFIGRYGMKSLKSFRDFISELENNHSYFEYFNLINDVKISYTESKIEKLLDSINNIETLESKSEYYLKGHLIGINTENGQITFREKDDKKITVKVLDKSLQINEISVNKYYELLVTRKVIESIDSIKEYYECSTIEGTTLTE